MCWRVMLNICCRGMLINFWRWMYRRGRLIMCWRKRILLDVRKCWRDNRNWRKRQRRDICGRIRRFSLIRKSGLIKQNIPRHNDFSITEEDFVSFVMTAITNKSGRRRPIFKFVMIIWPQKRITKATKHSHSRVVRFGVKELFIR